MREEMQDFGPPDGGPLQGLVASRIETYGGRSQASPQSTAGSLYPQGGPLLVSSGCALKATWVEQEGRPKAFKSLCLCRFMGCSVPTPHPYLPSWALRERRAVQGQAPGTLGQVRPRARRSQGLRGGAVRQVPGTGWGVSSNPGAGTFPTPTSTWEEPVSFLRPASL